MAKPFLSGEALCAASAVCQIAGRQPHCVAIATLRAISALRGEAALPPENILKYLSTISRLSKTQNPATKNVKPLH
jgi:hypothetical protein